MHRVASSSQTKLLVVESPPKAPRATARRRANDLDGRRWLQNSISVWNDIRRTPDEKKRNHPAMFPVQLVRRLLETFTNSAQRVVLDPFLGTGSTLVAAQELGKTGVGFDISQQYVEIALERLGGQIDSFKPSSMDFKIVHADAARLMEHLPKESVDICITSPPYWDILSQPRSADGKPIRDYHAEEGNLGHIRNYQRFVQGLRSVFEGVFVALRHGSFCIVDVMDIRKKSKLYTLHIDLASVMNDIGFELDDIIIWDRRSEYNDLRPLGYPAVFRVNRIHEYLMIFQKPKRHDH